MNVAPDVGLFMWKVERWLMPVEEKAPDAKRRIPVRAVVTGLLAGLVAAEVLPVRLAEALAGLASALFG